MLFNDGYSVCKKNLYKKSLKVHVQVMVAKLMWFWSGFEVQTSKHGCVMRILKVR